jgi:FtsZ-binding cell division protein ZapB
VSEKERSRVDNAGGRLAQLKEKVERATRLIAELRETNYALTGELSSLKHKVESLEERRHAADDEPRRSRGEAQSPPPAAHDHEAHAVAPGVHEELQMLRDERKIIRARVQNLLERIEKLDL